MGRGVTQSVIMSADEIQRIQAIVLDMGLKGDAPADILNAVFGFCDERGIDHFLAYRIVARTLERLRQYRLMHLRQVVNTRMQSQILDDLNTLQEMQEWYLEQFRSSENDVRSRASMGKYVQKLIEMKLRYSDILSPNRSDDGGGIEDPVPLSLYRKDTAMASTPPALESPREDDDGGEAVQTD